MSWEEKLHSCFGLADRRFALHPSDEEQAFEVLSELRKTHIGWGRVEEEIRRFLQGNKHLDVDAEVDRVRTFFRPWLLD